MSLCKVMDKQLEKEGKLLTGINMDDDDFEINSDLHNFKAAKEGSTARRISVVK